MLVLGLCGSLRRASYNRRLLHAAAAELPHAVTMEVFEALTDIPPYSEDSAAPHAVRALRDAITAAGAVVIATPEYNSSVPGQLKNALDWASRPFPDNSLRHKPVAVVGASTGAVRRGLGAGRTPQGAGGDRRPRHRRRAARRAGPRGLRR